MDSIAIYEELKQGGEWLGAARRWMQSNVRNGDTLTWCSAEQVTLPFYKLEELAMRAAVAAVAADRAKKLRSNTEGQRP